MQRRGELKPHDMFRDMEFVLLGQRAHGWPGGLQLQLGNRAANQLTRLVWRIQVNPV